MAQTINGTSSFMTEVFSDLEMIKASRGFMSIFGRGMSKTEYVDDMLEIMIDLIRGKKNISQLLTRSESTGQFNIGSNVTHTTAQKFQNAAYEFPFVSKYGSLEYSQTLKRIAGEVGVNSGKMSISRAQDLMAQIVKENMIQNLGRMELEASESMRTGVITMDDGGTLNFNRATTNTIVPSVLWSTVATASPIGDLDDLLDSLQENGKTEGQAAVFGYDAFNAMLGTDEIANIADNRRLSFVQAGDSKTLPGLPADMMFMLDNGFKYAAYVTTYKGRTLYIFTYNEKYQNAADAWTDYMPSKDVLIFDHTARFDRYFGPPIRFNFETEDERIMNRLLGLDSAMQTAISDAPTGVIDSRMFHTDGFLSQSKTSIEIETYSSPIYSPTHVDAAGILDGVIA